MAKLEYSYELDTVNLTTYDQISKEFAVTRAYVWQCVKDFSKLITNKESLILEIGCGNGKNIEYITKNCECKMIGVDTCQNFVDMCKAKQFETYNNNILDLQFSDFTFDYMLCIAVFHHLLSEDTQISAMNEILRIMKPNSIGIITCWSVEQPEDSKFKFNEGINVVLWKGRYELNKIRYYYVYSEDMFRKFFDKFSNIEIMKIYNEVGNWIIFFRKNNN